MNAKLIKTLLLAMVIVGGCWLLANRDQIQSPGDLVEMTTGNLSEWGEQLTEMVPEFGTDTVPSEEPSDTSNASAPSLLTGHARDAGTIRVASFQLNPDVTQIRLREPIDLVAEICRHFDVVFLQNLDRNETTWIKSVIDSMNRSGQANETRNDYIAISDRSQRDSPRQTVLVFNRQTVQLDHSKWYVVNDPERMLSRPPMVAWFRALGAPSEQAFTFTVADIQLDPQRSHQELGQLGTLIKAIGNDGRNEDDVLLIGDFQNDDRGLTSVRNQAGLAWVINNQPTTVDGRRQLDNLLFREIATNEFTGRGGVFDFASYYQLSAQDAAAVARHFPVWAEFSIFENANSSGSPSIPGRVAQADDRSQR